jgi:hypothetical protein
MNILDTFLVGLDFVVGFLSTLDILEERVLGEVGFSSVSLAVRFFPTILLAVDRRGGKQGYTCGGTEAKEALIT